MMRYANIRQGGNVQYMRPTFAERALEIFTYALAFMGVTYITSMVLFAVMLRVSQPEIWL